MSYLDLYVNTGIFKFGEYGYGREANIYLLGVPFDSTSSYRGGARFAPSRIREASRSLETYSWRTGLDAEKLQVCDLGDLETTYDAELMLERLSKVVGEITATNKKLLIIGGEHTVTLGGIKGLNSLEAVKLLIFDAHMDLRDEYPYGQKVSHATVTRRIAELIGPENIALIGVRAVSKEEISYAEENNVFYITARQVAERGSIAISQLLRNFIGGQPVYVSLDMDVIDPAYAPGVQTPEPEGLTPTCLIDIFSSIIGENTAVIDIVEHTPVYDPGGITSILAAKILYEALCYISRRA